MADLVPFFLVVLDIKLWLQAGNSGQEKWCSFGDFRRFFGFISHLKTKYVTLNTNLESTDYVTIEFVSCKYSKTLLQKSPKNLWIYFAIFVNLFSSIPVQQTHYDKNSKLIVAMEPKKKISISVISLYPSLYKLRFTVLHSEYNANFQSTVSSNTYVLQLTCKRITDYRTVAAMFNR